MTALTGVGALARLVLRRDRVRLPVWIAAVWAIVLGSAASVRPLYPDQDAIDRYAELFGDNAALVAFAGPGYGFDDPNLGVILVNEVQLWACIATALMSIFLVNRHTRAEEDAERADLLRAGVIGRHAPAAAAVGVVAAANVGLAALCGAGLVALGYGTVGSVALAGSFAACGLAFTGVTAVAAQLAGGSRTTLGLASAVLGASFALRAVGDIAGNGLTWVSPIGWAQGVRAYAGERWWALGLAAAFSLAAVAASFWLSNRRDLGSGILAQRPGPARAAPWMTGPTGLALRLQLGSLVGWSIGLFLVGIVYGSLGQDVEDMLADNPAYGDFLAQLEGVDLTDSFFATAVAMQGLLAAGFAISSALRVRSEEAAGRVEVVLAAPISRWRWAAGHLVLVGVGTVVVVAAGGVGIGTSYAIVSGDAGQVLRLTAAALATVPAVLVLAGFAVALFGSTPRFAPAAWAGFAAVVLVQLFGEILRLPSWARALSPLHHVPGLPAEGLVLGPLAVLTVLAAVLVAVGLAGFRARDLRAG